MFMPNGRKELAAQLTISSYARSNGPDGVSIEITDSISGCRAVQIDITHEEFGRAVTGLGHCPCLMDFNATNIGLKHEHKTELVTVPDGAFKTAEARGTKACKPFEVDGWLGSYDDTVNAHRRQPGQPNVYAVTFHRWVTP